MEADKIPHDPGNDHNENGHFLIEKGDPLQRVKKEEVKEDKLLDANGADHANKRRADVIQLLRTGDGVISQDLKRSQSNAPPERKELVSRHISGEKGGWNNCQNVKSRIQLLNPITAKLFGMEPLLADYKPFEKKRSIRNKSDCVFYPRGARESRQGAVRRDNSAIDRASDTSSLNMKSSEGKVT